MRHLSKLILACALSLGCATTPAQPPKWLTSAQTEIAAAQAAGADQIPAAQDHLAKANAALAAAKAGKVDAEMQGSLAYSEAELALNLAKEAKVRANLQAAMNQLNALKAR
jgi:hypothetical protein